MPNHTRTGMHRRDAIAIHRHNSRETRYQLKTSQSKPKKTSPNNSANSVSAEEFLVYLCTIWKHLSPKEKTFLILGLVTLGAVAAVCLLPAIQTPTSQSSTSGNLALSPSSLFHVPPSSFSLNAPPLKRKLSKGKANVDISTPIPEKKDYKIASKLFEFDKSIPKNKRSHLIKCVNFLIDYLLKHPESYGMDEAQFTQLLHRGLRFKLVRYDALKGRGAAARFVVNLFEKTNTIEIPHELATLALDASNYEFVASLLLEELKHATVHYQHGAWGLSPLILSCRQNHHVYRGISVPYAVTVKNDYEDAAKKIFQVITKDLANLSTNIRKLPTRLPRIATYRFSIKGIADGVHLGDNAETLLKHAPQDVLNSHLDMIQEYRNVIKNASDICNTESLLALAELETQIISLPAAVIQQLFPTYSTFLAKMLEENNRHLITLRIQISQLILDKIETATPATVEMIAYTNHLILEEKKVEQLDTFELKHLRKLTESLEKWLQKNATMMSPQIP